MILLLERKVIYNIIKLLFIPVFSNLIKIYEVKGFIIIMFNKNSLNNKIINTVVIILCIVLIYIIVSSIIIWEKTSDLFYIISGVIVILGILFNIYLLLKEKR